jgi:hypothetical protein
MRGQGRKGYKPEQPIFGRWESMNPLYAACRDVESFATARSAPRWIRRSVKVLQVGGQGAELSFTGPETTAIIDRMKELPADVHDHAGGVETELTSYDTIPIPIPIPTAEQRADRDLVLQDCASQNNGFLSAMANVQLALDPGASQIFANLPDRNALVKILGDYRSTLSQLIDHAIQVSTGQMDPPQMFVANPAPPAVSFPKQPFLR